LQVTFPTMPRKKPIRTLSQVNSAHAKMNLKRARILARVNESSFVAEVSMRYVRRYMHKMSSLTENERKALFQSMPPYETVVARANKKSGPFRLRWEQRARAKRPRKYKAYAIGAETRPGGSRLPLNLNAFLGDFARGAAGSVRQVWNGLGTPLEIVAANVTTTKDPTNPRADSYRFMVGGDLIVLKFGQFERIFTASRKPRKIEV
jgi:hypothetical protein